MADQNDGNDTNPENDPLLAGKIRDSARQIWLAGLGAYTKAEEDAGRFFERLVNEGEQLETRTRGVVEKQIRSVEHRVDDVREKATGTWDKRVSGALRRLGIHRQEDVDRLEARIERLEAEVARLQGTAGGRDEEE